MLVEPRWTRSEIGSVLSRFLGRSTKSPGWSHSALLALPLLLPSESVEKRKAMAEPAYEMRVSVRVLGMADFWR